MYQTGVLVPTWWRLFLISLEPTALTNNGRLSGAVKDGKVSRRASCLLFPRFPQAVNPSNMRGRNINCAEWEEVGDAVLFHTSLSTFVHKRSIFIPELKHPHYTRCFTDGHPCGWQEVCMKAPNSSCSKNSAFFPWKYQETILSWTTELKAVEFKINVMKIA